MFSLIDRKGLLDKELAKDTVDRDFLSRIRNGHYSPNILRVEAILDQLGYKLEIVKK